MLRGGLTEKHVDVPELLRVLRYASGDVEILRPEPVSEVESLYRTPAPDFALSRVALRDGAEFAAEADHGPELWLCVDGAASVAWNGHEPLAIERGESVFVPADAPAFGVAGTAALYRARVGSADERRARARTGSR